LSTIGAFFRGHLLFTERVNPYALRAQLQRAEPITGVVDIFVAIVLATVGFEVAFTRPLAGTLTIALAVGIALSRLLVEPSTTRAAFGKT